MSLHYYWFLRELVNLDHTFLATEFPRCNVLKVNVGRMEILGYKPKETLHVDHAVPHHLVGILSLIQ